MMRKSLLVVGLVATAGFLLAVWRGYQGSEGAVALQQHLYWALGACLLMLLSHSAISIYLAGTARVVRVVALEHGFDRALAARARQNVRHAVPAALIAIAGLVLTVLAGAGLLARFTPRGTHHVLVYLALAAQLWAMWCESRALAAQDALIADLDRRVGS